MLVTVWMVSASIAQAHTEERAMEEVIHWGLEILFSYITALH